MNAKTVRVRIAVAVNAIGHWNACGSHDLSEKTSRGITLEGLAVDGPEAVRWIEADVPLPDDVTVEGECVQ